MTVPLQNIYYLIAYAVGALPVEGLLERGATPATTSMELLHELLCASTESLLVHGLERAYVEHQSDLRRIRGRPDLSATIGRALLERGQVRCVYDEFSNDTLANRILRSTLEQLMTARELPRERRLRARRLAERFQGVRSMELTPQAFEGVQLHRNNQRYRLPLGVCELLLRSQLPTESEGRYRFEDFTRNEQRMGYLFESFIRNFIRREMPHFRVSSPRPSWITDATPGSRSVIPSLRTDIVLGLAGETVVVECKYTHRPLKRRFQGRPKLNRAHLSQLLTYQMALAHTGRPPRYGMLLYAEVDTPMAYNMVLNHHPVSVRSVNLAQPWTGIHDELLRLGDEIAEALTNHA